MNCNIVKDLIPLYIDGCCSQESEQSVREHIENCSTCKKHFEDMRTPTDAVTVSSAPIRFRKLNDWKASVLQSLLLFLSFGLITVGVAFEAEIPSGFTNGLFATNLVVPATGFMLSLANWYFVRVYKSRKLFSNCSLIATFCITLCAYIWCGFHYSTLPFLFDRENSALFFAGLRSMILLNKNGIILTLVFCTLSKILSNQYAKMLGKE